MLVPLPGRIFLLCLLLAGSAVAQVNVGLPKPPKELGPHVKLLSGEAIEYIGTSYTEDGLRIIPKDGGEAQTIPWVEISTEKLANNLAQKQVEFVKSEVTRATELASTGQPDQGRAILTDLRPLVATFDEELRDHIGWEVAADAVQKPAMIASTAPASETPGVMEETPAASTDMESTFTESTAGGIAATFEQFKEGAKARVNSAEKAIATNPSSLRWVVIPVVFALIGALGALFGRRKNDNSVRNERQAKLDREDRALKMIRGGTIAGIISAVITFGIVMAVLLERLVIPGVDEYMFIDVGVIVLLTLGIHAHSRIAAVLMVLYFTASKVIQFWETPEMLGQNPMSLVFALIFFAAFFRAMVGTFKYHAA